MINRKIILFFIITTKIFCKDISSLSGTKMLMICRKFPRISESFILNQIVSFLEAGVDLDIVAFRKDETGIKQSIVTDYDLLKKVEYYTEDVTGYLSIIEKIENKKYNFVYCQYDFIGVKLAMYLNEISHKPLFISAVRGGDLKVKINRKKSEYDYFFSVVDLILPVCEFYKLQLRKNNVSQDKIRVQHSAINLEMFPYYERNLSEDKLHIVTVARLTLSKGLYFSIEAIVKLHKKYPHIFYSIVGGGPMEADLKKLISSYNADDYIKLIGWKNIEEIALLHRDADIFILPSIASEGIPNALMEAMASGIPVISTYLNGIPELVKPEKRGLLVNVRDAHAIAEKILFLINFPDKAKKMALNARKYVEKEHSINTQNKKLIKIFENLM